MFKQLASILICSIAVVGLARAHEHADVEFHPLGGALFVPPMDHEGHWFHVFPGEFGAEATDPANYSDHPGFAGTGFNPGDLFGFNVVRELLYWDGSAMAPAPADHSLEIRNIINSTVVTGFSGFQTGFTFATADADGDVHQHVHFTLHGPGAPSALTPGGYGLWLQLTSPQYGTSNDFVIMLNYGLDQEDFEAGVHYVGAHVIPEPSVALLFAVAALPALRRLPTSRLQGRLRKINT